MVRGTLKRELQPGGPGAGAESVRRDGPFASDHARGDVAAVVYDGGAGSGKLFAAGQGDQIGEGVGFKFADLSPQTQGARAVDRGHLENGLRRDVRVTSGEGLHFEEQVQLQATAWMFANRGQAVRAEAKVHAGAGERAVRKILMLEIIV